MHLTPQVADTTDPDGTLTPPTIPTHPSTHSSIHPHPDTILSESASSELDELRAQCDALILTDEIDKKNALAIMSLFHCAITLILHERHERAQEIARMNHELEMLRLSCRNADMLESSIKDISLLKHQVGEHATTISNLESSMSKLHHQVDAMPQSRNKR